MPAVMANGRIVELLREGQKLVFGDKDETAWQLMIMGGFISMDSGFAHDLQVVQRREIVAAIEQEPSPIPLAQFAPQSPLRRRRVRRWHLHH